MRSGLCRVDVSMHSLLMQADTVRPPADSLKMLPDTQRTMCVESLYVVFSREKKKQAKEMT